MIKLTKYQKIWILICKGHLLQKYPPKGLWTETFKKYFFEVYGWDPEEYYNDYLICMFNVLLEIHHLIEDNQSGDSLYQIKEIFSAAFNKSLHRDQNLPIERSIAALAGLIQNTRVINNNGSKRFDLII
jgi:hypothetical protein